MVPQKANNNGDKPALIAALTVPHALEKVGIGTLAVISDGQEPKTYGRSLTVAERINNDRVVIAKWVRRLTNWNGRQAPNAIWEEKIVPLLQQ